MEHNQEEVPHTKDVIVADNYLFTKFFISENLLRGLKDLNYMKPSPIQLKIIPLARSRLDMIIQSKSGTGKTLAFSICLLENYDDDLKFPQALVIVPTREIAVQITNILNGLGKYMRNFKANEFIGGTDLKIDRKRIQTTKIVIGTPGRILHLIKNDIFNTSNIKTIVFDEADKLFEHGHLGKDVQSIFKQLDRTNLQIIASTATVTAQFENQIKKHMKNPIGITPKHEAPVLIGIKQFSLELLQETDNIKLMRMKLDELAKIFTRISFKQCLLFTDSQSKTESYGMYLNKLGWKCEVINGSQEQSQRLKVLNKLAKFKCRLLITTDLMARGIDIDNINLVINLDLPYDCFTYLHRIGRAGRFGTYGIAITFLNGEMEALKFKKMLDEIGSSDTMVWKFPSNSMDYNFWEFNDQEQNKQLAVFDGRDLNGNRTKDEIVDENLWLLEITRKLVDGPAVDEINGFDTDALLDDYERSCGDETEKGDNEVNQGYVEDNLDCVNENEGYIDKNGCNSNKNGCNSSKNDNDSDGSGSDLQDESYGHDSSKNELDIEINSRHNENTFSNENKLSSKESTVDTHSNGPSPEKNNFRAKKINRQKNGRRNDSNLHENGHDVIGNASSKESGPFSADFHENNSQFHKNTVNSSKNGTNGLNSVHENGHNDTNVDSLIEEYEKACQINENCQNVTEASPVSHTVIPDSPKEKRCIVFVRQPADDQELSVSSDSAETFSGYNSDNDQFDEDQVLSKDEMYSDEEDSDSQYSEQDAGHNSNQPSKKQFKHDEEYSRHNEQPENRHYREFAQLNNNNEYHLYDQYVMDNYIQWRRSFYFQIANIQNYVNENREGFM